MPDGDQMSFAMKIISGWILLSVPIALLVGRVLRAADRPGLARLRLVEEAKASDRSRRAAG
jgi:hypothetical protein